MRVLHDTDLRWIAGGECTFGHADVYDLQAAEGECIFAQLNADSAWNQYYLLQQSDPNYQTAYDNWQAALAAVSAANDHYNDVALDNVTCPGPHRVDNNPHSW